MEQFTVHAAKTNLSQLLVRIEAGEEIVIARGATPVAMLVPMAPARPKRQFGALSGQITVGPGFFAPLPDEDLEAWGS